MPNPISIPNVGSQLDRAIRFYGLSLGLDSLAPVFTAYNTAVKSYPCVIIHSVKSSTLNPQTTSIQNMYDLEIRAAHTMTADPDVANMEAARVLLDAIIGAWLYAMLQSADGSTLDLTAQNITNAARAVATLQTNDPYLLANNADLANFTLQHLWYEGDTRGAPKEAGDSWIEVRHFRCNVIPANAILT